MKIQTTDQLRALYKAPSERAVLKELTYVDPHIQRFISLSPFLCIGTAGENGLCDVSPRGGEPGSNGL